jgi:hypothetical protein
MNRKSLFNQLKLAYSPLTTFEFAKLKDDKDIIKALEKSSLYIIGQRPIISFQNVVPDYNNQQLIFEIHQKGNSNILECKLPLIQPGIGSVEQDELAVAFNFFDKSNAQKTFPLYDVHGFSIIKENESNDEFLIWFSPEKLLNNWWNGHIECQICGEYRSFLNYEVHYVGKATKQKIFNRLNGHSTLQEILSLEGPITKNQPTAHEIVILMFEFNENLQHQIFDHETDPKYMADSLLGRTYPSQETVFLDAEKALIKAMQPRYNRKLFINYPRSSDGLYLEKYNAISYTFLDPIVLKYEKGELRGGLTALGGDSILILDNKEIQLIQVGHANKESY